MTSPLPEESRAPETPEPGAESEATKKELTRRELLKILAAGGAATVLATIPAQWTPPQVEVGVLPAHAAASLAPPPPTQLSARAISNTQVDLTWEDNSTVEIGFTIQRSTDGVTGWAVLNDSIGPDTTTYSDTTVAANTRYYYRIYTYTKVAIDRSSSSYSNVAVVTTPP